MYERKFERRWANVSFNTRPDCWMLLPAIVISFPSKRLPYFRITLAFLCFVFSVQFTRGNPILVRGEKVVGD